MSVPRSQLLAALRNPRARQEVARALAHVLRDDAAGRTALVEAVARDEGASAKAIDTDAARRALDRVLETQTRILESDQTMWDAWAIPLEVCRSSQNVRDHWAPGDVYPMAVWIFLMARDAFRDGEIDYREMMRIIDAFVGFLEPLDRLVITALAGLHLVEVTPKFLNRKRPAIPRFVKQIAVRLVCTYAAAWPGQRLRPDPVTHSSSILERVIEMLCVLGVIASPDTIQPETIYRWYREEMKQSRADPDTRYRELLGLRLRRSPGRRPRDIVARIDKDGKGLTVYFSGRWLLSHRETVLRLIKNIVRNVPTALALPALEVLEQWERQHPAVPDRTSTR